MTWDAFSAIAATTHFCDPHPCVLLDPSKHVGTSTICVSEDKLLSTIGYLALSAESAKVSSVSLEAWPSQNLVCSVNVFLDVEHNPRTLQNFSKPLHPFPITQLANTHFRFISYTPLDFVEVKNPLF